MTDSTKIVKNTIFLYVRMIVIMAVTLYTSRIVLHALGIEDFGIYNLIAGLATSFIFFSSSLSNATQRFLNFEMSFNQDGKLEKVFRLSLLIYLIIGILVLIGIDTIGVWFLRNKLNVPADRMYAAYWVLHTFALSTCITLITTAFDSLLFAHEDMKIYAYIGMLESISKLIIAYILLTLKTDKLILYGVLLLLVTLFVKSIPTILYCTKKYSECKIKFYWNSEMFREIAELVGWNGFGCFVWAVNEQGMAMLLNIFFGPVVNAAKGISMQVNSNLNNFVSNFMIASRPQIIQSYSNSEYNDFISLIFSTTKFGYYLMWLLSLPLLLKTHQILHIWLGEVPEYTVSITRWVIIFSLINTLQNSFFTGMMAVGKLKKYIIVGSIIFLFAFPISYFFLKLGFSPTVPFIILAIVRLIYVLVTNKILNKFVSFSYTKFCSDVLMKCAIISSTSFLIMWPINTLLSSCSLLALLTDVLLSIIISAILMFYIGMNKSEREYCKDKILTLLRCNTHVT